MKSREIIVILEAEGWRLVRVNGSHHQYRHRERPGVVTVPHPKAQVAIGTVKSIERKSGLNMRRH